MALRIKLLALAAVCSTFAIGCDDGGGDASADAAGGAGGQGGDGGAGGQGGDGGAGGQGGDGGAGGQGGDGGQGGEGGQGGQGGEGGVGGEGGQGGAGGAPPMCDAVLDFSETCDVANDCCDRGLTCAELSSGQGTCLRTCDANAEVSRCAPRELCNPNDADVPSTEPSPGICIPGDDCQPGLEEVACGAEATCARINPASFCAPPGTKAAGEACGINFNNPANNCAAGLACEVGACRTPCGENDACGEGETCLNFSDRLDGLDYKFCYSGCNVMTQEGCEGENAVCVASTDTPAGGLLGACLSEAGLSNGPRRQGETCTADDNTYWGNCSAGYLCDNIVSEDGPAICNGWCDSADRSLCTGGSVCYQGLFNTDFFPSEGPGLCLGECNGFTGEGCGEGTSCNFTFIGFNSENEEVPTGFCFDGQPTVPTGGRCTTIDEDTGASDCLPGHLCATLAQGAPPECIKLCADDPDSDFGCPPGTLCTTGLFGGDQQTGEGANDYIGACLPN